MIFNLITRSRSILSFNQLRLGLIKMTDQTTEKYSIDIGGMRIPYKAKESTFTEKDLVSKEPIGQFKKWFDEACKTSGILEPNAMCLSTATRDGTPSSRYVLLKSYGSDGFKFYTNYNSRKCKELDENPQAALAFYWEPLARQVRVEGCVEKLPEEESCEYFQSRPRESQLGAHVSKQSEPIAGREVLTDKKAELKKQYGDECIPVPKPKIWGGFIVKHHTVEFWQGQTDRLHDRIRFRRLAPNETVDGVLVHQGDDNWVYERLSP